jgi:hypothetical protein
MNSSARSTEFPFVAEGGITLARSRDDDPYRALDDLMAVVEVLCRAWPRRDGFDDGASMLL